MMVIFASTQHIVYTNMYKQLIWRPVPAATSILGCVRCILAILSSSQSPDTRAVYPLAVAALPLATSQTRLGPETAQLETITTTRGFAKERERRCGSFEPLQYHQSTLMNYKFLFPGIYFAKAKTNCKKQLAVFILELLQFIFLFWMELNNILLCFSDVTRPELYIMRLRH